MHIFDYIADFPTTANSCKTSNESSEIEVTINDTFISITHVSARCVIVPGRKYSHSTLHEILNRRSALRRRSAFPANKGGIITLPLTRETIYLP